MTHVLKKKRLDFGEARSTERQQGVAHLCAAGPRVVLEALLEVSRGKSLDTVLRRYGEIPLMVYRKTGAGVLPIHREFDAALRRVVTNE